MTMNNKILLAINALDSNASAYEQMVDSLQHNIVNSCKGVVPDYIDNPEDYFYNKYGNGHLMDVRYRYQSEVIKVIERTVITIMLIRCYVEDIHENLVEEKYTVTVKFNTNETD